MSVRRLVAVSAGLAPAWGLQHFTVGWKAVHICQMGHSCATFWHLCASNTPYMGIYGARLLCIPPGVVGLACSSQKVEDPLRAHVSASAALERSCAMRKRKPRGVLHRARKQCNFSRHHRQRGGHAAACAARLCNSAHLDQRRRCLQKPVKLQR